MNNRSLRVWRETVGVGICFCLLISLVTIGWAKPIIFRSEIFSRQFIKCSLNCNFIYQLRFFQFPAVQTVEFLSAVFSNLWIYLGGAEATLQLLVSLTSPDVTLLCLPNLKRYKTTVIKINLSKFVYVIFFLRDSGSQVIIVLIIVARWH